MLLHSILQSLGKMVTWWVVVAPWEQAIRVRAGKNIKLMDSGIYLKIPFLDRVFRQSVRRRISIIRAQTLTTRDNHTITLSSSLGFAIDDLR